MFSLSGTDFGTACISGATGLHLAIAYGNDELADILVSTSTPTQFWYSVIQTYWAIITNC